MKIKVEAVDAYIPKNRVSNQDLAKKVDTSDEWIRSHTGIGARHIASEEETLSYMAAEAAKKVLAKSDTDPLDVDMIILSTITPDYSSTPSSSCIVQDLIGAKNAAAFDIKAACSGFVYGMEIARGLMMTGQYKKILVIGAEKMSSVLNWEDRSTCVLFGDAAGAVLLSPSGDESGLQDSILRAEGQGALALYQKAGGTRNPFHGEIEDKADLYLTMDGRAVYNFAVRVNVSILKELMERNRLSIDDVDWVVPHQANARIISAAAKRLNFPQEKFFMNLEEYANTSAASIPLALTQMEREGKLKRGQRILTVGFGAGLTYAGNYIIW
ncbi:MAG: ketoacyl-ACP synthase III [Spirochaetaceae bacterium]|jgi:3-oxoacyl-[acyl-carrier-protein] synthase-3|nr:ketoacyl-ACP synthase III [Spirochaetaceae bacterium]